VGAFMLVQQGTLLAVCGLSPATEGAPTQAHAPACMHAFVHLLAGTLKEFMRSIFDPHDKLDEITIVFTWNYYALLSGGTARVSALLGLFLASCHFMPRLSLRL